MTGNRNGKGIIAMRKSKSEAEGPTERKRHIRARENREKASDVSIILWLIFVRGH